MKLGGFQVSPSDLLSAHSPARWKPVSPEELNQREWTRLFALSTGWGLRGQCSKRAWVSAPTPQAPCDFQSWRAVFGRLYGGASPPRRGHHPPPLPTSCLVLDARWACLSSSGLQGCAKNNTHNRPRRPVTSSFSLLSSFPHHVDLTSCFPACPVGTTPSNEQSAPWPHCLISN